MKPANWKPKSEDDPDPARLRAVLELAAEKVGLGQAAAEGQRTRDCGATTRSEVTLPKWPK